MSDACRNCGVANPLGVNMFTDLYKVGAVYAGTGYDAYHHTGYRIEITGLTDTKYRYKSWDIHTNRNITSGSGWCPIEWLTTSIEDGMLIYAVT